MIESCVIIVLIVKFMIFCSNFKTISGTRKMNHNSNSIRGPFLSRREFDSSWKEFFLRQAITKKFKAEFNGTWGGIFDLTKIGVNLVLSCWKCLMTLLSKHTVCTGAFITLILRVCQIKMSITLWLCTINLTMSSYWCKVKSKKNSWTLLFWLHKLPLTWESCLCNCIISTFCHFFIQAVSGR